MGGKKNTSLDGEACKIARVRRRRRARQARARRRGLLRRLRAANVLVAAGMGHEACVAAWLDAGASVEFGGRKKIERPLHKACGNGHAAAAAVLLDRGADLEARDKHAKTALYRAAEGGKDAVVELLLRRGAERRARREPGGHAARGGRPSS
ncbi:hypothetical protein JL722_10828 [Aureococcus anophagefferens]|nr:hypothetical protein JL722_10828 [Aureococcus anophagefferens]